MDKRQALFELAIKRKQTTYRDYKRLSDYNKRYSGNVNQVNDDWENMAASFPCLCSEQ